MKNLRLSVFVLSLLLPFSASGQTTCEATGGAQCYYTAPGGSGTACSYASPCRLRDAVDYLSAGDYLYLLDGDYPENEIPETINGLAGTSNAPITIKNYPDQNPVLFQQATAPVSCARRSMTQIEDSSYVVFDGIVFKHDCYYDCGDTDGCNPDQGKYQYMIYVMDSDRITFKNSEVAGSTRYRTLAGIQIQSSDYVTVENSYLHDFTPPTGDEGGDESDWEQGNGEALYAFNSDFLLIKDNTIRRCNHACITVGSDAGGNYLGPCKYVKIVNNMVDARYGGGIYVGYANMDPSNEMYSLIEGNVIVHVGDTTSKGKGGLFITGSRISIRKNVVFSPSGGGLEFSADNSAFRSTCPPYSPNNNLIYNNTIFGTGQGYAADLTEDGGYGLYMFARNCDEPCTVENNTFINNIFYKSSDKKAWISSPSYTYKPELLMHMEEANSNADWLASDGALNWGGNIFHHNLIRKNDEAGETYSDLIIYGGPGDGNHYRTFNITEIESDYSDWWYENIGGNPDIASEVPDDHGLANGWWSVPENSAVVNNGEVIDDTIGWEVESQYPGWGWGNLKYSGSAPDIGAFEYGIDDPDGMPNVIDDVPKKVHAGGCTITSSDNASAPSIFLIFLVSLAISAIVRVKWRF